MLLTTLVLAAMLEIGGDAAIRFGLLHTRWRWLALGAATLFSYGLVVNANRTVSFGHLMGLYIAVFFAASQLMSLLLFGEIPSRTLVVGGALIVAGGLVVQLGAK